MKNRYIINEETDEVIIYLTNRKGETFETFINIEDFEKINNRKGTYFASFRSDVLQYYCCITTYCGQTDGVAKYKTEYLHRIIFDVQDPKIRIDHEDHDSLNNRRSNLRVSNDLLNIKNRKGANKNNKTGIRNVCYYNGEYLVQVQVEGKSTCLGKFDDIEEARIFAEEMRKKHYGEYAGGN